MTLHPSWKTSARMNYRRYIESRILDINYLGGRLQRLFSTLSDADYDALQALLKEAEGILKKYVGKG
jgi:hypothetical protein